MHTSHHAFEKHITLNSKQTVVHTLAEETKFSINYCKEILRKGAVWLTHKNHTRRIRRAKKILTPGDEIHIYYDPKIIGMLPSAAKLITDEGQYSVWDKPAGMLSQGSKWGDHNTLYRWAEKQLKPERPAFIVHRLDRAASGLMIIAHSKKMARAFSSMFANNEIDKLYQATVTGRFDHKSKLTINQEIEGKQATSHVSLLGYDQRSNQSEIEVKIETGRKHQIRKHLAALGHPIIGDRLYGSSQHKVDLQLIACKLSFTCPISHTSRCFSLDRCQPGC